MKLKRFKAPDTRQAMQLIKQAFGPDAVILSSSKVADGVEVVAAVDFDQTMLSQQAAIASAEPQAAVTTAASQAPPSLQDMREEILTLRGMLEAQLRSGNQLDPLKTAIMQRLVALGVSLETAAKLTEVIEPHQTQNQAWQAVLQAISNSLTILDQHRIEEGGIFAFVGPTGVGKTTTLAKIAARFVLRNGSDQLGLISMDTYRIAAQEQLVVYGKIFGVDVYKAEDEHSLSRVIKQLARKKLILIDTAGVNPADARMQEQMQALHTHQNGIGTVLTLAATNHYQVVIDAIRHYRTNAIHQCVITKLDESKALGGILAALIESGLPISYLTDGQRVPEDIKLASRYQLIEQLNTQEQALFSQTKHKDVIC